jgi:PAS domain S-box-containing protein
LLTATPGLPTRSERRQRRALQGIALGFSLLVTVCLAAGLLAWKNSETTAAVMETYTARQSADLAMEQILLAETSQRGYLLTRDQRFLPNYRQGLSNFNTAVAALKQATRGDPELSRLAVEFELLATAKFQELDQTIALTEAGQGQDALALVQSGIGEDKMQRARDTLRSLNDMLARTMQANVPWQRLLPKVLLAVIGAASICVIGLSAIVLRDTRRNLQFLAAREMALRQLAATLENRVQRRTRSLTQANQRFDAALRAARVTVFTQDTDLRFTWISSADPEIEAENIVGRGNAEVVPNDSIDAVLKIKQQVLVSGEPGHAEVRLSMPGGEKWFDLNVHPLRDAKGEVVGLIGGSVEITERKEQEARIRLLMREVTHRSKNLLSVIQAIMRQTATHSLSIEDFQKRFADRLHSLAGSHDLLVQENWNGAGLRELIRSQLGHYSDLVGSQIRLSGPAVQLRPDAAQHIGMALHELATNAAKYGALSAPSGRVDIKWSVPDAADIEARCHLSWVESDGPPVVPPSRRGFGRVVIERTVARALDGEVEMEYLSEGVRWRLSFPQTAIV